MMFGARSGELSLQREDFSKTLKGLKALAKERPEVLDDPVGVLAARTLEDALAAAFWRAELDEHGDIVALEYLADKLPKGAENADDFLRVLAKTARGSFLITREEAESDVLFLERGKLLVASRGILT